VTDTKIGPGFFARDILENWNNHRPHCSRKYRAADDDRVPEGFVLERFTDLLTDTPNVFQVEIAVGLARCAHTNEGQVCFLNGFCWITSSAKSP
jgi:hypothetical protein